MMFAVEATFFAELFGAGVRYTGLSIAYQVSAIVGGFTPLISAYLLQRGGGAPWLVAGFLAGISLLSLVCAALAQPAANLEALSRFPGSSPSVAKALTRAMRAGGRIRARASGR